MNLRNPHLLPYTCAAAGGTLIQFSPLAGNGGTYGPGPGQFVKETFDSVPSPVVGQQFCGQSVVSVTKQTIYANFITQNLTSGNNIITVSFGGTYNTLLAPAQWGVFFPMAVPLLNGTPLLDVNNNLGNGANAPVPALICSVNQLDTVWQAIIELPSSLANFNGVGVRTFADDGGGNWVIQDFVYGTGHATVVGPGGITVSDLIGAGVLQTTPSGQVVWTQAAATPLIRLLKPPASTTTASGNNTVLKVLDAPAGNTTDTITYGPDGNVISSS
jgi:hypothetical protein